MMFQLRKFFPSIPVQSSASLLLTLLSAFFAPQAYSQMELYYVHNDHLATPQVITDSTQQIVWRGYQKPFGEIEETVLDVVNSQRFPGQHLDSESGLNYNYFRDYDPSLGRYIQSDPIGLKDGPNTYAYVYSNPIIHYDSNGESVVHAARGAFWAGGRVGAGLNYGVHAATGASIGSLLYDALNDNTYDMSRDDGGDVSRDDSSDDSNQCEDDDNDECAKLFEKINRAKNGIARRFRQLGENRGEIDQRTHWEQLRGRQRNLRKLLNEAATKGCNVPSDAWYWASR